MNREIKFRAWDENEKKMWPVDELNFSQQTAECDTGDYLQVDEFVWGKGSIDAIKPNTILMQFTGLKDKTGKEIYEGDIVMSRWEAKGKEGLYPFEVRFNHGHFAIFRPDRGNWRALGHRVNRQDIEIIGNIYETPELLK